MSFECLFSMTPEDEDEDEEEIQGRSSACPSTPLAWLKLRPEAASLGDVHLVTCLAVFHFALRRVDGLGPVGGHRARAHHPRWHHRVVPGRCCSPRHTMP